MATYWEGEQTGIGVCSWGRFQSMSFSQTAGQRTDKAPGNYIIRDVSGPQKQQYDEWGCRVERIKMCWITSGTKCRFSLEGLKELDIRLSAPLGSAAVWWLVSQEGFDQTNKQKVVILWVLSLVRMDQASSFCSGLPPSCLFPFKWAVFKKKTLLLVVYSNSQTHIWGFRGTCAKTEEGLSSHLCDEPFQMQTLDMLAFATIQSVSPNINIKKQL